MGMTLYGVVWWCMALYGGVYCPYIEYIGPASLALVSGFTDATFPDSASVMEQLRVASTLDVT